MCTTLLEMAVRAVSTYYQIIYIHSMNTDKNLDNYSAFSCLITLCTYKVTVQFDMCAQRSVALFSPIVRMQSHENLKIIKK